ncbi:MAG TPA: HAD-IA family hydrolase [Anaerolineales bacterium]|nr:HAD-IA family hydrolase [Anaerolineales bacterium]
MNSNHRIQAIFFDLDGTLRHSVPEGGQVFDEYVLSLGYSLTEEDRLRALRWEHLYWANSPDLRDDLLAHSADTENFWIEYSRRRLIALGISNDQALELAPKVSAHMGEVYAPQSVIPADVQRVLPQLKRAGYLMAVISNRDEPFDDLLEAHGIREFFDFSLAAGEINIFKPDPGVFTHALQRVNVNAEETIYVGDNYFADVVGARRAGLHPILYDPNGIFPEADCRVIQSFDELISILNVI